MSRRHVAASTWLVSALAFAWLVHGSQARGQTGSENAAAAETLYDDARRLLEAGKYAEACPKLEESQRLDPAVGTLLYLALCYERTQRIASAWSTYRAAQSHAMQTGQHARAKIAQQHAAQLEPRLPKLLLRITPDAPSDLKVTRNGLFVGRAAWGQVIPVDPGEHVIQAKRGNSTAFSTTVRVEPGELRSIDIRVPLVSETEDATHSSSPKHSELDPRSPDPDPRADAQTHEERFTRPKSSAAGLGTQRWLGIGTSVLGLGALGVGAGYAARSVAMAADADEYRRPGTNVYDEPGYSINRKALDAKQAALISTLIGSVTLTSGVIIYLTAPARGTKTQGTAVPTGIVVGANSIAFAGVWQ